MTDTSGDNSKKFALLEEEIRKVRQDIIVHGLDMIRSLAERPTYLSTETGFRHGPLTNKEKIERYEDTCKQISEAVGYVIEAVQASR